MRKLGVKRLHYVTLLGILLSVMVAMALSNGIALAQFGAESVPGELIVGLKPGASSAVSQAMSTAVQGFGGQIIDEIPEISAIRIKVPDGGQQSAMAAIQNVGNVDYIEANYEAEMLGAPDDEYWDKQWGPAKIKAPEAWALVKGSKDILVAVVDTGVDYTHPDLKADYDPHGHDYVHNDDDPYPVGDSIGGDRGVDHGTHVAGIIGAIMNNDKGIAGLAQVPIIGIRVLNDEGSGSYWNVAKGIVYAANAGAKIINLSLGGGKPGKVLESAINFAQAAGCLIIAAAGNAGKRGVDYPAKYDAVIAVSATDQDDDLASFSSYGPEVELAAPGVKILSTTRGNHYALMSGTSMAAPHVAGVAALVWAANPKLTGAQVRKILCNTADDLGPTGRDKKFGYGRVNAYKAVKAAKATTAVTTPPPVPSAPSAPLSISVDKGAGANYQIGDRITVNYTVAKDATVKLYRIGYADTPELLATRAVSANSPQTLSIWAEHAGVETIVIQARTSSGRVLTQACMYSIGGVGLGKANIRIDKGCGANYRIGEPITISVVVDEASAIKVIDFATDGSVSTILQQHAAANETVTLPGRVVGPAGQDMLILVAGTDSGTVITSACKLVITE